MNAAALDVRVLDRVDVDREPVRVRRPALRARADHVAAVEAGGVVGIERALVDPVVGVNRAEPADREARQIEPAEDANNVVHDRDIDHQRT